MKVNTTLVFFTLQYPYGTKSETFIENEIQYLAEAFHRVIIIPREKNDANLRQLPKNVEVSEILINNFKLTNHFKFIFSSVQVFITVFRIYFFTLLFDKNRIHYLKGGYFIYYLANSLNESKILEAYIKESKLENSVFYDYWFVNSTLPLAYLKSKSKIKNLYCRAHGFDVFNDRWDCGSVPFREYILEHLSTLFAISSYNKNYIIEQLNNYKEKVKVSYLGVNKPNSFNSNQLINKDKNEFLIVSCANLFPFKQVQRIPDVLKLLDLNDHSVKWVHFGDGLCEPELLNAAKELPNNIKFDYKGHVNNQEVLQFYTNTAVDLFISLSFMEGLPVSMMEAQSFGIPIMAYSIFGIPEIVNETTGILLDKKATNTDIARKINCLINKEKIFNPNQIKQYFNVHFNAAQNFKDFTNKLQEG